MAKKTANSSGNTGQSGPGKAFLIGFLILFGLALLVGILTVLFP